MRFMEIANPEDQLALWKLISDKMWGAFAQQLPQTTTAPMQSSSVGQSRAALPTKPMAKHVPKAPEKSAHKSQPKAKGRATKPKRAPMAPAPKQLPKPVLNKPAPPSITDPNHIDQATRRWLPPDKRGPNPIDLLTP